MILSHERAAQLLSQGKEGKPWRPVDARQAIAWAIAACGKCISNTRCSIQRDAMLYDATDTRYPREWAIGPDGQPVCTAREVA